MAVANAEQFQENPASFIEQEIKNFVTTSPYNRLTSFNNEPVFDEPLVGFADGDDPLFKEYKTIIGDSHVTPREAIEKHIMDKYGDSAELPVTISVISYILPITYETRLSLRKETQVASLRWNHTRWQGQELMDELVKYMVGLLEELGNNAVAPDKQGYFKVQLMPDGLRKSNWSQRHIAYAAGLGTFSLNDGFITPKGIAMRCGSIVCDVALPPSPRLYENHLANCLFYSDGSCRRCIERCPSGAVTENGHDKVKCHEFLMTGQKELLQKLGRFQGYIGRYIGCGLCQTKVPCEAGIPYRKNNRNT
jgi:epoxyqueuosine reductase QueG